MTGPGQPFDLRCQRSTGISGRYSGSSVSSTNLRSVRLELRLDVDTRYSADSPVMNKVSGDHFTRTSRPFSPGAGAEVYSHSWIVDDPAVTFERCNATITGDVRFFSGSRPATTVRIVVDWQSGTTTAAATFSGGVSETYPVLVFVSDAFRTLELEMDYCESAHVDPLTPTYGTHQHTTRPPDITDRPLTIAAAYREAGVDVTDSGGTSVVDDSAAGFATLERRRAARRDGDGVQPLPSAWPNWRMWGLLAGRFDSAASAGSCSTPGRQRRRGRPPERQGFAVFRNHPWFTNLVPAPRPTRPQVEAMRQVPLHVGARGRARLELAPLVEQGQAERAVLDELRLALRRRNGANIVLGGLPDAVRRRGAASTSATATAAR